MELALFGPEARSTATRPAAAEGLRATRRYFGAELCEHLLASGPALVREVLSARAAGLSASLVLPPVGPGTWPRVRTILTRVAEAAPGTEVVANDWGVLRGAARDERLVPVLGRCLNRMLRDPRLGDALGPGAPAAALEALGGGPFASAAFARLRARLRVSRVEIDVPLTAIAARCFPADLPLSLWVPTGLVATGRVCLPAAVHRPPGPGRFAVGPCHRECRQAWFALRAPREEQGPHPLSLRGNAVLVEHDAALSAVAQRLGDEIPVDRIVWQTDSVAGTEASA